MTASGHIRFKFIPSTIAQNLRFLNLFLIPFFSSPLKPVENVLICFLHIFCQVVLQGVLQEIQKLILRFEFVLIFCPRTQSMPLVSNKICLLQVKVPFQCPQTQNLPFDSDIKFFQELKGISQAKDNAIRIWHFCPLMAKLHLKTKCNNLRIDLRSKSTFKFNVKMPFDGKSAISMPSECTQIFTVYPAFGFKF